MSIHRHIMSLSRTDNLEISGSDVKDESYMHISPSQFPSPSPSNQPPPNQPPSNPSPSNPSLVSISAERLKYLEYLESNISSIVDSAVQEYKNKQNNVMKKKCVKNKENKVQAWSQSPKVE